MTTEERTPENGWRLNDEHCPHCGASLQGEPVPEKYLTHEDGCNGTVYRCKRFHTALHDDGRCHAAHNGLECGLPLTATTCMCFPYGKVTHFGRQIGVEIQGVYDGVLYYQCPDCEGKWHRNWGKYNTEMRRKAEPYVSGTL